MRHLAVILLLVKSSVLMAGSCRTTLQTFNIALISNGENEQFHEYEIQDADGKTSYVRFRLWRRGPLPSNLIELTWRGQMDAKFALPMWLLLHKMDPSQDWGVVQKSGMVESEWQALSDYNSFAHLMKKEFRGNEVLTFRPDNQSKRRELPHFVRGNFRSDGVPQIGHSMTVGIPVQFVSTEGQRLLLASVVRGTAFSPLLQKRARALIDSLPTFIRKIDDSN